MTNRFAPDSPVESQNALPPDAVALHGGDTHPSPTKGAGPNLPEHWLGFGQRLLAELRSMQEDDFLIVLAKESNRFVQFAAQGALGFRVEATSNHFLRGAERLDAKQMRALLRLGWRKPTGTPQKATPEKDPGGSANYFLNLPPPVDLEAVVERAVVTLSQVFGVPHEGFLVYESFDLSGNDRGLPDLRLKRQTRDPELRMSELADGLLAIVKETTGIPELDFDEDGDIAIGLVQGQTLFVCLTGQPPQVRFHAPLLTQIRSSKRLLEHLNQLNLHGGPLRYLLLKKAIVAVLDIPAWPLTARHVAESLEGFAAAVQGSSAWLQAEFGKRPSDASQAAGGQLH